MRRPVRNVLLVVALANLEACGDQTRGNFSPADVIRPRYGDFVIPLDSVTVQPQVGASDTFPVRLHPRAPFSDCSPWILVTHYGWGASFTLYGVKAPPVQPPCPPIVAHAVLFETDSSPFVPLVFVQPDSTLLRRYIRVETEPMRIDSSAVLNHAGSDSATGETPHVAPSRRSRPPRP